METHLMNTYNRIDVCIEKAKGNYVYDSLGNKYLDFIGGIGCIVIGHSNPRFVERITQQANKLVQVSNLFYTVEQQKLAEKLAEISGLDKCFLCNSGSEANEAAIKLAKKIKGKRDFIVCEGAFHGRTLGSLSATWNEAYKKEYEPLLPWFKTVAYDDPGAIKENIDENTAAVMIEPIQGEAGVIVPSHDYLNTVKGICEDSEILLILDEVQTGNGRTGKFFSYEHNGIVPDIVTTAKGLANGFPIGACLSQHEFCKGEHGSTFGGNSLASEAACATIDYILENDLMSNAVIQGEYLMKNLKGIDGVKKVKGIGLMIGFEVESSAKKVVLECLKKGLLVNDVQEHIVRLLPPLTISEEESESAIQTLEEVLGSL